MAAHRWIFWGLGAAPADSGGDEWYEPPVGMILRTPALGTWRLGWHAPHRVASSGRLGGSPRLWWQSLLYRPHQPEHQLDRPQRQVRDDGKKGVTFDLMWQVFSRSVMPFFQGCGHFLEGTFLKAASWCVEWGRCSSCLTPSSRCWRALRKDLLGTTAPTHSTFWLSWMKC